jgi:hypothetical protein
MCDEKKERKKKKKKPKSMQACTCPRRVWWGVYLMPLLRAFTLCIVLLLLLASLKGLGIGVLTNTETEDARDIFLRGLAHLQLGKREKEQMGESGPEICLHV